MLPPCEFPNFPVFLHQLASSCSADSLVRAWLAPPGWASTLFPPRLGQLGRPLQPSFWPKARLKCRAKSCIQWLDAPFFVGFMVGFMARKTLDSPAYITNWMKNSIESEVPLQLGQWYKALVTNQRQRNSISIPKYFTPQIYDFLHLSVNWCSWVFIS